MGFLGTTEMLIIAGVIVLLFGASKLPKLGGAVGESIKNFKKGVKDDTPKIEDDAANNEKKDGTGGQQS
ncbi:MAG: Sec-independent protein translocase subunit TatA/TatB [Oligoflexus sp.]